MKTFDVQCRLVVDKMIQVYAEDEQDARSQAAAIFTADPMSDNDKREMEHYYFPTEFNSEDMEDEE